MFVERAFVAVARKRLVPLVVIVENEGDHVVEIDHEPVATGAVDEQVKLFVERREILVTGIDIVKQRPVFVLDLVEEFRVPIVDMAIFPLFVSKEVNKRKLFEKVGQSARAGKGQYQLSAEGKAVVVEAVMKHLYREAKWDSKEYAMKRIIENQIRALARHFMGKETEYKAFDTT